MKKKEIGMPLEMLRNSIEKDIRLIVRKDKMYTGKLKAFDQHLNIYMENVYEIIDEECKYFVGTAVINGGTIAMIDLKN